MSKRSKRRQGPQAAGGEVPEAAGRAAAPGDAAGGVSGKAHPAAAAGRRSAPSWSLGVQVAFLAAVFAVAVLVAELAGAANLGVALGVGEIAFAIAAVYLLVRR